MPARIIIIIIIIIIVINFDISHLKATSKKPDWLAELSRKQQHRKSEKFIDQSKRPVLDVSNLKTSRHSLAVTSCSSSSSKPDIGSRAGITPLPFGIHSLNRGSGVGNRDIPPPSSSENLENLTSTARSSLNKFDHTESTSVNAMVNSTTKPVILPISEKPQISLDKPHIPSKPLSATFNKDGVAGNDTLGA